MSDLTAFLLARIAEDKREALKAAAERLRVMGEPDEPDDTLRAWPDSPVPSVLVGPERVLAECEAKRRIVDWHKNWPVLIERQPDLDDDPGFGAGFDDVVQSATIRMTRQFAWATEQRYRETFGTEPPTGPILRLLALPYADHPDYRDEWRPS